MARPISTIQVLAPGRYKMAKNVLIVDDSRTSRMFIQQALEIAGLSGATFVEAANGIEALSQIQKLGPFHLMVTDINMPGKGGMELISELNESKAGGDVAIFVISSTQSTIRDAALKEMGVRAVLEKPINMQKMIATFAEFKGVA
ncbi:MAG: response regulator [Proteobacteria bacterium]|nr:MAG: response regulator [Pseudomonadota bacterium]